MGQDTDRVVEVLRNDGLAYTLWGQRIICAAERGYFTYDEIGDAGGWVTCACGKVNTPIRRVAEGDLDNPGELHKVGSPVDPALAELGALFYELVKQDEFLGAAGCLVRIERRADELAEIEHRGASDEQDAGD